jgi:hypothetical protein
VGLIMASESVVAHDMVSMAWLLENRTHLPEEKKAGFIDNSPVVARLANYWVVSKLGGVKPAIASDKLVKNELKTIWDDRVLNQAYKILGGVPKLTFHDVGGSLPTDLKNRLTIATSPFFS